jgi:hypothetical protein
LRDIVAEAGIETREIELVVEQVIQSVFEGAAQEFPLQVHRDEARTGVDVFVARHLFLRKFVFQFDSLSVRP